MAMIKEETATLGYKKYIRLCFSRNGLKLLWYERDGRWQMETEEKEYRLTYWPITSSLGHTTPSYTQIQAVRLFLVYETYSTGSRHDHFKTAARFLAVLWDAAPVGHPATCLHSPWQSESLLDASCGCLCLTLASAYIISQRSLILLNHVTDFVFLHRSVLCREISDGQLCQESICNAQK